MIPGDDPLRRQNPETGGKWVPPQRHGTDGVPPDSSQEAPPQAPYATDEPSAADTGEDRRTRADRLRKNRDANKAFVVELIGDFPPTEKVDDHSIGDALVIGVDELRDDQARALAREMVGLAVWKHESFRRPSGRRRVLKRAGPRWLIGEMEEEGTPCTKQIVIAECDAKAKVTVRVVRVDADAYDSARRLSQRDLMLRGLGRQYKRLYDRDRRVRRVAAGIRGVVGLYRARRDELEPTVLDGLRRRVPAEPLGVVVHFTDGFMRDFDVYGSLERAAEKLGLKHKYDELLEKHGREWRPSPGQTA